MHSKFLSGCGLAAVAICSVTPAIAQERRFDIPSLPMSAAIAALGEQAHLQIIAPADGIEHLRSRPVHGMIDPRVALRRMIAKTGLEIVSDDGARIVLRRVRKPAPPASVRTKDSPPADTSEAARAKPDIVVTGLIGSLKTAREMKRRSDAIMDVIAAEDVNQLPDNSATEALARLPGVQIFRNRGEGQSITIRGINQVVTTIDGQEAYTGVSRRTLLNSYPAGLIRSMEVYKALTPDLVEGGIGGAVNIELRKPLDLPKGITVAGTARGSWDDQADKFFYNGDLLVSGNWDTGIGEIGVLVNAAYTRRDYQESYRENYTPQTNAAGQIIPSALLVKNPEGHYERPVVTGEIQWRPAYNFGMHLRVTQVTDENTYSDTDFQTNIAASTKLSNVELVDGTNIVKSATFTATANSGPRSNHTSRTLDTTQIELGANFHSGIATLKSSAVYTMSHIDYEEQLFLLAFNNAPVIDAQFQSGSKWGGLSYTYQGGLDLSDISQYHVRAYSDTRYRQTGNGLQWRTDLDLDTGPGFFRSIKTGFRFATRSADYQYGTGLANLNSLNLPMSAFPGGSTPITLSRRGNGDDATLRSGWVGFDSNWFASSSNVVAMNQYVSSLTGMSSLFTDNDRPAYDPLQAFHGDETSFAYYGMVKYGFDLAGLKVDGVVGARAVNSWLSIDGTQRIQEKTPTTGGTIVRYEPVHGRQNYLDLDPSVSAVVHFSPRAQLRLAYTKTFSRPDFSQLNPQSSLVQVLAASGAYVGIASAGNPELKPIRSANYDASLEYYFGRAGLISVAGFYRDVDGYIVSTTVDDDTLDNSYGVVQVTKPVNAGDGAIKGVEANLTTFFDFAPGVLRNFGVSANYTYTDSYQVLPAEGTTPELRAQMAGISKNSYNLNLFYDDGHRFRARVGYSWRSGFTLTYNRSDPNGNLNWYPISRLAASATYRVTPKVSLTVDGTNLLARPQRAYWGTKANTDRVYFEGRVISAALRFRF